MERFIRLSILSWLVMLLVSCTTKIAVPPMMTVRPVTAAPQVNLTKYSGTWYEIASFPNRFQNGCRCTQANYQLAGDDIKVINQCTRGEPAKISQITGKAWVVPGSNNSKLKVQFVWPFKGDYWIVYVSPDYRYSVVGTPTQNYLWILARTRKVDNATYQKLVAIAKQRGYANVGPLQKTLQNC